MQIFPICGMAAAMGALVHSPIGGGIFAVEIILRTNMRYKQLFPAILASTSSVFLARHLGLEPIIHFPLMHGVMDVRILPVLLLTTFIAGFAGKLFIFCYSGISHLFQRNRKTSIRRRTIYMMCGSLIASIVFWVNPSLMGTSSDLFDAVLSGARIPLYGGLPHSVDIMKILFVMFILKGMANIFTVGSGMSAGFAGPAILMGLLLGAGFAEIFGIPFGSVEYIALLAAGFASYFSSIMNTPIASAILTIELFGMYYSLPAGLAAVIGFLVNQEHTLYDLVLEEREEKRSEEIFNPLDKKGS
jgi:CIC family chloride channel protein